MPLLPLLFRPPARIPVVAIVLFKFVLLELIALVAAAMPPLLPLRPAYNLLLRGFNGGNVVEFISDM